MNCKPGDLAIVVKSYAGNHGAIVQCLRLSTEADLISCNYSRNHGAVWWVDRPMKTNARQLVPLMPDAFLLPIRPDESPEQSLEAMRDLMQTKKEKETT